VNLTALRFAKQNDLLAKDYHNPMMDNIDEVVYMHAMALEDIGMVKFQVTRAYNKKVRLKNFQVGDIF
jgi:hypothetical protein